MKTRAKMVVSEISTNRYNVNNGTVKIRLECQYDPTIPEDQKFFSMTPTGHFEMTVNNPAVIEQLQLGKFFYLDLVPVEG